MYHKSWQILQFKNLYFTVILYCQTFPRILKDVFQIFQWSTYFGKYAFLANIFQRKCNHIQNTPPLISPSGD